MQQRVRGLDGLRAIAVTAVMGYHAGFRGFDGGYLGVDLFFVLSGFLITTLLLTEREATGSVDLRGFYLRRIKRLLPAIVILLAVLVAVAGLTVSDAAAGLRQDMPWLLVLAANWHFIAADHTYFATIARPPLLQHMWSLAIEEQFYLVWPALLVLLTRARSSRYTSRQLVFAVSAAGAAVSAVHMSELSTQLGIPLDADPARVYFGSDTHIFGLLGGCALAAVWRPDSRLPRQTTWRWLRTVATLAASAVVLACLAWAPGTSPTMYHGGFAGFSLAAIALVGLTARTGAVVATLLEWRPLVWIGQRSYGMYLWHWPVFTLLRPGLDTSLTEPAAQVLRLGIVLVAAHWSYRMVELPVRRGTFRLPRMTVRPITPRAAVLPAALAIVLAGSAGVATAAPPESVSLASSSVFAPITDDMGDDSAPLSAKETRRRVYHRTVVFGDSVVLSGAPALRQTLGNVAIDAAVGRQPSQIAQRIALRRAQGRLGDAVVIHMGTNGLVAVQDLQPILTALADRKRVVVVNVRVPRRWMQPSNRVIEALIVHYPNVRLADWDAIGRGHRRYFTPDGVHLTRSGARVFAAMVQEALRRP